MKRGLSGSLQGRGCLPRGISASRGICIRGICIRGSCIWQGSASRGVCLGGVCPGGLPKERRSAQVGEVCIQEVGHTSLHCTLHCIVYGQREGGMLPTGMYSCFNIMHC